MAQNYYTILTNTGKGKIANAIATGIPVSLTHFAVGDGSGNEYDPTENQTILKNEVYRNSLNSINTNEDTANQIICEGYITSSIGGFSVVEVGIFDSDGDMIAIGKYPKTYKPTLDEGAGKDLYVKIIIEVSNTSSIVLKIDPSIVLASKANVDDAIKKHENKNNPHPQYLAPVGTIYIYAGVAIPDGFLVAWGQEVSRVTYANLFASIGTIYGTGNGNTTFNLPDLSDEFLRFTSSTRGVGTKETDAIRNITGRVDVSSGGQLQGALYLISNTGNASAGSGGGLAHMTIGFDASRVVPTANENRPRNIALTPLIKY